MISIIIAEDQEMLRKAMVQLFELRDDINVIADVADGEAALKVIQDQQPDVAIIDVEMPKMSGLQVLQAVKSDGLAVKIIIVTTFK